MLLHTPLYLLFLLVVALVYWALPRLVWRKIFLLVASYVFYALFDLRFAAMLLAITFAVFILGRAIATSQRPRIWMWLSVMLNLGVLAYFKYAGFFLDSVQAALAVWGMQTAPLALQWLLPVGISFYTFQAISYTIEIYRNKLEPAKISDFALYLAFFPKLIAGPLARPRVFLHQLDGEPPRLNSAVLGSGLRLLLIGLVKKLIIFFPLSRSLLIRWGRERARRAQITANLVTMTLIGLWHEAAWTFVGWGLWHGILLSLESAFNLKPQRRWAHLISGVLVFHLVGAGWVLFRAGSFAQTIIFFRGLFAFQQMNWMLYYLPSILLSAGFVFGIDLFQAGVWKFPTKWQTRLQQITIAAALTLVVALTVLSLAHGAEARPFIYGQF